MVILKKCDILNAIIKYSTKQELMAYGLNEEGWSFLVHKSVELEKFQKVFNNVHTEVQNKYFDLQIGDTFFEMQFIILTLGTREMVNFAEDLIEFSQFSFPWEELPTLYINVSEFNILWKFIEIRNLQSFIAHIEERPGVSLNGEYIKIVTFHQVPDKFDLFKKFKTYRNLDLYDYSPKPMYYYAVSGMSWLQPRRLKHFDLPINTKQMIEVFPIIFDHLDTMDSPAELNIFDFLTLRLCLCDFRDPSSTKVLYDKIDDCIHRILKRVVKNNHLDLIQYKIDANCATDNHSVGCFIYEFQGYFETIETDYYSMFSMPTFTAYGNLVTMKLIEQDDIPRMCKTVHDKGNVIYTIDGNSYDKMSSTIFFDLLKTANVKKIILDTNFHWINNLCSSTKSSNNILKIIKLSRLPTKLFLHTEVQLVGENTHNFVEEFIETLKEHAPIRRRLHIFIRCNLKDYLIFKNLKVEKILFVNTQIDTKMLEALYQCDLDSIQFTESNFESNATNWRIFNNLRGLHMNFIELYEDNGTWEGIFEYVLNTMTELNLTEFQLPNQFPYIPWNAQFTIDALNSKLELNLDGQPVDLYYWKNYIKDDDKSDYDFYQ